MSLKEYHRKRKFDSTTEPKGKEARGKAKAPLRFVVQKHAATRTHYDFRLEFDGTLKSWAVPKGPTLRASDPRLAVHVEDHPIEYGEFEGVIPKGNYGAGTVMIWDRGTFVERSSKGRLDSEAALIAGMQEGHITFVLSGKKLRGEFALVKLKKKGAPENGWLLIKKHDAEARGKDILLEDHSAVSGRTMDEIASQSVKKKDIWLPGKGHQNKNFTKWPEEKIEPVKLPGKAPKKKGAARATDFPHRVRPMEPAFASSAPRDAGWLFEEFGKGVRAMAEVEDGHAKLLSRTLIPLGKKYDAIVEALKAFGQTALFDGEIVKIGSAYTYFISDLLYHQGKDLRELSLTERKKRLGRLKFLSPIAVAPWADSLNSLDFQSSLLVAKKEDAPYHSGMTKQWLRFRPSVPKRSQAGKSSSKGEMLKERAPLTHPNKVFWPKEKITKGDLYHYYDEVAEVILPHLIDRPQSLHRQPNGIHSEGFFHKDMSSFLPRRIETVRISSASSGKTVNYALCQDRWSLLYLINLGCIELNPWLSRRGNLDRPDWVVIDLDPDDNDFREVVKVALEVHKILEAVGAKSFVKTSGSTGIHICVPTGGKYDFDVTREFAIRVLEIVQRKFPTLTSMERSPAKRLKKIYLDAYQNRRGQTLAAPYCVRPKPNATVSTPVKWSEVNARLNPKAFTIKTIGRRIKRVGDLWKPLLTASVDIESCMKRLSKRFHT